MSTFDYVLKIMDTSGTVTLTSSPFAVREFDPHSENRAAQRVGSSFDVRVTDGSAANNLDEVRTLNRLLQQAHERNRLGNRALDAVYLVWKESDSGSEWRSEVTDGRADWQASALQYPYWYNDTQFAAVDIERRNWWEGPEAQIPLTNGNGTNNTVGLTVYNHDDSGAGHDNYVAIAGTAVAGDLPGATRLELTNTYGTGTLGEVWIGHNYTDPDNFTPVLEAEAAAADASLTKSALATASGGSIGTYALASGSELTMFNWTLSSAMLDAAAGRFYKAMARFSSTPDADVRYRLALYNGVQEIWAGPLVSLDTGYAQVVRDLGTMRLPPWLPGVSSLKSINLRLNGYQTTGSPINVALDFLLLLPLDGYRFIDIIGSVAQNERIVDDGVDDQLYFDDGSGADKLGSIASKGPPIRLQPGKAQRLNFIMHSGSANTAEIARTLSVKLYYRPRRISL